MSRFLFAASVALAKQAAILAKMKELFSLISAMLICSPTLAASKTPWNNPPKNPDGQIQHETFHSAAAKTEVGYNIYLPPAYAKKPTARFPVIYYLHGYEGNESSYLEYARYWRKALSLSGPVILVFVNGGERSFFSDSPDGAIPAETLVMKELIPHIDGKFRTVTNASGRSLHGYSMGGFGALKLGFKYPESFSSVVAYGATLADAPNFKKHLGKVYTQMFGGDPKQFAENDPSVLAEKNAEKLRTKTDVYIVVGSKDEFLAQNRALRNKLKQLNIPVTYEEVPGAGHKKEDLFESVSVRGFQFSAKRFPSPKP